MTVGNILLNDQFEWPLFSSDTSPEEFSRLLCADLGIAGEFVPFIAHAIRDQVCNARLNIDDAKGTLVSTSFNTRRASS
jgi:SNF5 / SMARCB1 / INI1